MHRVGEHHYPCGPCGETAPKPVFSELIQLSPVEFRIQVTLLSATLLFSMSPRQLWDGGGEGATELQVLLELLSSLRG